MDFLEVRRIKDDINACVMRMEAICAQPRPTKEDKAEHEKLSLRVKNLKRELEDGERGYRLPQDPIGDDPSTPAEERKLNQAFTAFLRKGMYPSERGGRGVSEEQRQLLMERRDMGTGGGAAYPGSTNGFFVPVGFVQEIERALKYFGPMLDISRTLTTASGQPLPYPTANDTAIEGEQVAEGALVSSQDVSVSMLMLGAWKYSTKLVKVSIELMEDSAFDINDFLTMCFAERLGRVLNRKFTTGVGTTEPYGVMNAATVGVGGTSGTAVIGDDNATSPDPTQQIGYIDMVNLEHSVDPVYRPGSMYMFHDTTLRYLKTLKDKFGRPLWTSGFSQGKPDMINGYAYRVNNNMDQLTNTSPATTRKTVAFGRFDKYLVRKVREMSVLRLTERFAEYGQVAFIGFARYDGQLLDAGTHPVKYLLNPAS